VKCSVYRISGATPASNFINIPRSSANSLGLTGRYFYLLFKPIPNKYFSLHIDIITHEGILIRVSFSNLFKEFKTTSTWLQFPYVIQAPKGTVYEKLETMAKDLSGAAPPVTKWTVLCVDLTNLTQVYANRSFHYIRSFKICANVLVKNVITSDLLYEPGVTHAEARLKGVYAFPRELAYPFEKYDNWSMIYDYVCFPSESFKKPFDSVGQSRILANLSAFTNSEKEPSGPRRITPKQVNAQVAISSSVPAIDILTRPKILLKNKIFDIKDELPMVGLPAKENRKNETIRNGDIHVYPCFQNELVDFKTDTNDLQTNSSKRETVKSFTTVLEPDPILKLQRVIGFGGATYSSIHWTSDSKYILYPCHAVLICYHLDTGTQWCYIGHTDKISCLTINKSSTIVVSGQYGQHSFVRFWDFQNRNCLAVCKNHDGLLYTLEYSHNCDVLCGVGKDKHGKTQIVLWDTKDVRSKNTVRILAKASTDVHINCIQFVPHDSMRLVSCGLDNIRFWRVKDTSIRSCPINLSAYQSASTMDAHMDFTDIRFDTCFTAVSNTNGNTLYACTKTGYIFELDYARMDIKNVRVLQPTDVTDSEQSPIALNTLSISDSFCATGSDDGILRVWSLDFKQVCIEAEHDASITYVCFSPDYMRIVTATATGNLGILNILHKDYKTIIRSHTDTVTDASIDPLHKYIVTVSNDTTIRIWDFDTCKQLYDFAAPNEKPTRLCYHPVGIDNEQIFACGFNSGKMRVFNVLKAKLINELTTPYSKPAFSCAITDLMYSKDGKMLICGDSGGVLCLFNAEREYCLVRALPNSIAVFNTLCSSEDGRYCAVIGSVDTLITVYETAGLNEILRIDVSVCDGKNVQFDSAQRIAFAPYELNQIICSTNTNKLLKFDSRNGKLLSALSNLHRHETSSMLVSTDCKFLITTGDNQIKIWDYHMRLDRNFQIFVGHSEPINKVLFTPDYSTLITVGDALFFWDFLAYKNELSIEMPQGRDSDIQSGNKTECSGDDDKFLENIAEAVVCDRPRTPPIPFENDSEAVDQVNDTYIEDEYPENQDIKKYDSLPNLVDHDQENYAFERCSQQNSEDEAANTSEVDNDYQADKKRIKPLNLPINYPESLPPNSLKHLTARVKRTNLAKRFYTAPSDKCALQFQSAIGYNGTYATANMLWNPENGFFAYSIGCLVIVEDLKNGTQTPLKAHSEDITAMALQFDCVYMASASTFSPASVSDVPPSCQIVIWDAINLTRKKTLTHKSAFQITCLCYSKDDRFLVSVSDYKICSLIVWSTYDYTISASIDRISNAIHDICWDPSICNAFVTCGERRALNFWTLEEKQQNTTLRLHECIVPLVLNEIHNTEKYEFTCLAYGMEKLLFVATNHGFITVWDTGLGTCILNWSADVNEVVSISCFNNQLISGSASGNLKLWPIQSVYDLRHKPSNKLRNTVDGLVVQKELLLNGAVKCFKFDKSLDIGIVATNKGTLWYVNWLDSSKIRLVNTHSSRITSISNINDKLVSTCGEDGTIRIWSLDDREQIAQFEVKSAVSQEFETASFLKGQLRLKTVKYNEALKKN
jgi:WD40 repeat protein